MARPAIWKCPLEITDYVEDLIWKILDLERSQLVPLALSGGHRREGP